MTVFVNERPVAVPEGATAAQAVAVLDADLGARLEAGTASLTDARGLPLEAARRLGPGDILRVLVPARTRATEPDALA